MPDAQGSTQEPQNEPPAVQPTSSAPVTAAPAAPDLEKLAAQQRAYDEAINQVRTLMTYTPAPQAPPVKELDPNKILTDPEGWQRDLVGNVAGAMQQVQNVNTVATFEALADSAKHLSRTDPKVAPVWDKYGSEIEALAGSGALDPRIRGSKAFWDKAAKVVQAEHLEDIVAERASAMAAEMRSTAETGAGSYGAADPDNATGMEKLRESAWGQRLIERYGERGVMRNVEKLGVTLDKYAEMAAGTNVIVNPHNPSEWWNRDLMRGT